MDIILFLFLLLLCYLLIFAIFPRVIHKFILNLLVYCDYRKEKYKFPLLARTFDIAKVYLWMSLGLSIIFNIIFNLNESYLENLSNIPKFPFLVGCSFVLVIIIRITTLLNKTELIRKFSIKLGMILDELNKNYKKWQEQKNFMKSFLFSTILFGILVSFNIFMFHNVINYTNQTLILKYKGIYGIEITYLVVGMLIILVIIGILSFLGELLLSKIGVREECRAE